jgi:hypothetical protein
MKLHEIKPILKEQITPIHISMILQEICKAKKCTNAVHYNVLLQLVNLFKNGENTNPRYANEFSSSKEQLDELKQLKNEEQVELAQWCLIMLNNEENKEQYAQFKDPSMALNRWIAYVIKKQD